MSPSASSPPSAARLGFIGGGRMAQALAAGIAQRSEGSSSIRFHDPNASAFTIRMRGRTRRFVGWSPARSRATTTDGWSPNRI